MTARPSTAAPILAVLAIVLVTLGAYVGGYLWLGEYSTVYSPDPTGSPRGYVRVYPHLWQRAVFQPAAQVESLLVGQEVRALYAPE